MAEKHAPPKPATPETHKPYTTPEGYKAPAMSELWTYVRRCCTRALVLMSWLRHQSTGRKAVCMQANKAHPYYRYGYSLALGVGLAAAAYAWLSDPVKSQKSIDQK